MAVEQRAGPVEGADDNEDEPDSGSSASVSDADFSGSASWMQNIFGASFFQGIVIGEFMCF